MIYDLLPMSNHYARSGVSQPPSGPMKYLDADESEWGRLCADDDWTAEQKMDGTRALIYVSHLGVDWRGLKHTAAMQHFAAIEDVFKNLGLQHGDLLVLDGEILIRTGEYHLFDLPHLHLAGETLVPSSAPQMWRREVLERVFDLLDQIDQTIVHLVPQAVTGTEKERLWVATRDAGVEGMVFKNRHRPYTAGRTDSVRKAKFVKTADVVVTRSTRSRNAAGRETGAFSFGIMAPSEFAMTPGQQATVMEIDGRWVLPMGSCSAIGKPDAKVGDVIEVAYLYRDDSGGLVQPRMIRIREDKAPEECDLSQFPRYSREAVAL